MEPIDNETESAPVVNNHSSFVSGARPFILWVCGFALAYATLIEPLMEFVAVVCFGYSGEFPSIESSETFQALLGVLGLGGLRTYEKLNGVARR